MLETEQELTDEQMDDLAYERAPILRRIRPYNNLIWSILAGENYYTQVWRDALAEKAKGSNQEDIRICQENLDEYERFSEDLRVAMSEVGLDTDLAIAATSIVEKSPREITAEEIELLPGFEDKIIRVYQYLSSKGWDREMIGYSEN